MEQRVSGFADQRLIILFERGDNGLDRFLAKFLGNLQPTLAEKFVSCALPWATAHSDSGSTHLAL